MKDRIRMLMESQHMTQLTFANYTGISPATVSSILSERTKPTLNTVEAIKNKFPNISIEWLMFGKGEMFPSGESDKPQPTTLLKGNAPSERMLDFSEPDVPTASGAGIPTSAMGASQTHVLPNPNGGMRADVVYKERDRRKITEIRVFFDDQTYESFVPRK